MCCLKIDNIQYEIEDIVESRNRFKILGGDVRKGIL